MVHKYEPEAILNRIEVAYSKVNRERQTYMQELDLFRKKREKEAVKCIKDAIGPKWYQTLSCPQREALDTLEFSIYQDILEGRPVRTAAIMKQLGLYPRPNNTDLMSCVLFGRNDPKQMLAKLFLMTYSHEFHIKRADYPLNAKLILSAILYLGLENLISLLKKRFQPEPREPSIEIKEKPKPVPPPVSPYLQEFNAYLYLPPKKKPFTPAPLPNLDDLNEPFEDDAPLKPSVLTVTIQKPLAAAASAAKKGAKRMDVSYCEKMAGIKRIEPHSSETAMPVEAPIRTVAKGKFRKQKSAGDFKKTFGTASKSKRKKKKLVAPSTGMHNVQYAINGVFTIKGKTMYVLGSITIMPPKGVLIHGGFKYIGGDLINVHCGYQGPPPQPLPDPCDCLKTYQDVALDYVKRTKCWCNHFYDYGNDGTFPPSELPYFERPKPNMPFQFHYDTIYDLDEKHLFVRKQFKRFWDTDSLVHLGDPTFSKSDKKKKKVKRTSSTCLGGSPTPEDYLKCALRLMVRLNIAAMLPDIHLVPELKEWMRYRIHGPLTVKEKKELLRRSTKYWQILLMLSQKGVGHVYPPKEEGFSGHTTWAHKQKLVEKFRKYIQQYRLELFRSYANVTNMLWPTMFQAEFHDKSFRQIYFSYLFSRVEEVLIMHPYSSKETMMRMIAVNKNRYRCPLSIEPQ